MSGEFGFAGCGIVCGGFSSGIYHLCRLVIALLPMSLGLPLLGGCENNLDICCCTCTGRSHCYAIRLKIVIVVEVHIVVFEYYFH